MSHVVRCADRHQWTCDEVKGAKCPVCGKPAAVRLKASAQPMTATLVEESAKPSAKKPAAAVGSTTRGIVKAEKTAAPARAESSDTAATLAPSRSAAADATLPPEEGAVEEAEVKSALPSQELPGYEILSELGRGGMGVVYKAKQSKLGRTVALKMILAGGHAGEADLARFRLEAEAVAHLQHPGIVQIHETGVHNGLPFFSLEFVPGGSLSEKLNGTPLPPKAAARMAILLAEAMQAAHDKGIVHRDLKPANVFLMPTKDKNGVPIEDPNSPRSSARYFPKIGDFGLAKKIETDGDPGASAAGGLTATNAVMGTPSYMAPEQAGGKAKELGPPADIYALGAILYDLLTGRPPFRAATPVDTLLQVISEEPPPPTQLNHKIPRDLETICLKCLHKEPAKRYGSAQELADDLERYINGEPIHARAIGRIGRAVRWCSRNKAVASLIGAVAATLLVGVSVSSVLAVFATLKADEAEQGKTAAETAEKKAKKNEELANEKKEEAQANFERAEKKTKEAEDNFKLATQRGKEAADEATRNAWLGFGRQLGLSYREWQDGNAHDARQLLDTCRWDFRNIEHRILYTLYESNQVTLRGHSEPVRAVALSPDGKKVVSAAVDKTVRVWDAENGRILQQIDKHTGPVNSVALSPDGKKIISGSDDKTLRIWNVETGKQAQSLEMANPVTSVAWSKDGKRFAASSDRTATIWDADNGKPITSVDKHQGPIISVALSPDGKKIVCAGGDDLKVWNVETGESIHDIKVIAGVRSVAFSPDGSRFVSGHDGDGAARIWDAETGKQLVSFTGHPTLVFCVAFSPDSNWVVSGGDDWNVRVWSAQTGQQRLLLRGHTHYVNAVGFSGDGKRIASADEDRLVKVWNADVGQAPLTIRLPVRVERFALNPDGTRLVCPVEKTCKIFDTTSGREVLALKPQENFVFRVAWSPDGKKIATAAQQGRNALIWDAATGEVVNGTPPLGFDVAALAFTRDSKRLVCGANGAADHAAFVCSAEAPKIEMTLRGHTADVSAVAVSPDGTKLATVGLDLTVRVWDANNGKELLVVRPPNGVMGIDFSPDSKRLVTAGPSTHVWSAETGEELVVVKGSATNVAFSPDGKRILTGAWDQLVRLWNAENGQETLRFHEHRGNVECVAFSPGGKFIASASDDNTIKVWRTDKEPPSRWLEGHVQGTTQATFTPDDKWIVTGGGDGFIKIWNLSNGQEALSLTGHKGRLHATVMSLDGKTIASAGADKSIRVWSTASREPQLPDGFRELVTFKDLPAEVIRLALSGDGSRLVSGSQDGHIDLWDVKQGKKLSELGNLSKAPDVVQPMSLAFSADGKRIACGAAVDGNVTIWDAITRKEVRTFKGHKERGVSGVLFTVDGSRLISSGDDGAIKIWDTQTWEEKRTLSLPDLPFDPVGSLTISADGKRLATTNYLGVVRVWDVEAAKVLLSYDDLSVNALTFSHDGKRLASSGNDGPVRVWDLEALAAK